MAITAYQINPPLFPLGPVIFITMVTTMGLMPTSVSLLGTVLMLGPTPLMLLGPTLLGGTHIRTIVIGLERVAVFWAHGHSSHCCCCTFSLDFHHSGYPSFKPFTAFTRWASSTFTYLHSLSFSFTQWLGPFLPLPDCHWVPSPPLSPSLKPLDDIFHASSPDDYDSSYGDSEPKRASIKGCRRHRCRRHSFICLPLSDRKHQGLLWQLKGWLKH